MVVEVQIVPNSDLLLGTMFARRGEHGLVLILQSEGL